MKKITVLIFAVLVMAMLTACGSLGSESNKKDIDDELSETTNLPAEIEESNSEANAAEPTDEDTENNKVAVVYSRKEQQKAFEELVGNDGIVYAPKEGKLVSVNVEEGDKLTNAITMISYVCADSLTISVDVTEEDIVSLSVGQPVDIIFTAYPDESFEGVIKSIDTTATSTDTNTVSYPVVVSLEGNLSRMYGGMTANISFEVESKADTLYISRKALIEDNGNYYVYVKSGLGEYDLKLITIGLKNTSYVEITSGLEENDTIYIMTTGA